MREQPQHQRPVASRSSSIFEHLVTSAIDKLTRQSGDRQPEFAPLDLADSHERLARHLQADPISGRWLQAYARLAS